MYKLENLNEMSFMDQINTINNLEKERQFDLIPEMFEYIKTPLKDEAIQNILEETLRNMLAKRENSCIEHLISENERVKKFCLKVVKRYKISSAVPQLLKLEKTEKNQDILHEILYSISSFEIKSTLKVFQKHLDSTDDIISSLAIKMIGVFKDGSSFQRLADLILDGEKEENYESCSLTLAQSIQSIGQIKSPEAIPFLARMVHHKNPTARRIIHQVLYQFGDEALEALKKILFNQDNIDKKILTCNILGAIKSRASGELLIKLLDTRSITDKNILFALYEALGQIPFLKGSVALLDALKQNKDPYILMAVVTSLNQLCNQVVVKAISQLLKENPEQKGRIIEEIVNTGSVTLFEGLFPEREFRDEICRVITNSNNALVKEAFLKKLQEINSPDSRVCLNKLDKNNPVQSELKILAVDDSKAMRLYYSKIGAMLGYHLITAIDGEEALEKLQIMDPAPSLILSDLNMPKMNGIELTRKLKESDLYKHIPVILVTTESDQSQVNLARNAGVQNFINKPFDEDTFLKIIAETLG